MFDVFEKEADRIFMIDGDESITYAGVKEESGRIYHYLKDKGIGKEDFVHIIVKKDIHFFSCMLGVWRAGAAFVINDVSYPKDRLKYIGRDVDAKLILDAELFKSIMEEYEPLEGYEETGLHDACYAVYTSGSTGNPKGVLHEYGNLDQCMESYLLDAKTHYRYHYRSGYIAPLNFVVSIMGIVCMISCAMTNFLVSDELLRDYLALTQFIENNALDCIFLPPSYIRLYRSPAKCLKMIETGSEPANRLYYEGGVPKIVNSYGTSEAGFRVLSTVLDKAYDVAPVGRPCLDVEFRLIDDEGEIVEGKGEGELCFKNEYVRGYIGLPEKTKEAFVDGFYHTGDICRRDENGVYYICGRKDDMFKINGNRIEPAEIERRVKEITRLERVHVQGFQDENRAFIAVYYIIDEAKKLGIYEDGRLKCDMTMLGKYLPPYMLPSYYVGMEKFPLNINGKLDRRGFKPPKADEFQGEYTEPANELEKFFCDCMREVLGINRVGAEDDFYAIGGDSIGAMRLITKCGQGGHEINIGQLYACRTPRKLAALGEILSSDEIDRLCDEALGKPQPVTHIHMIYIKDYLEHPKTTYYNISQLFELKEEIDPVRLCSAVDRVIKAHPALLTKFVKENDGYKQVYDERLFEPTQVLEIADEELEERKATLTQPMELIGGRLYRSKVFVTPTKKYLFMDIHHSVCDGASVLLINDQIHDCYTGQGGDLPKDHYYYFASRIQENGSSENFREAKEYYDAKYVKEGGIDSCSCILKPDKEGPDIGNGVYTKGGFKREGTTADSLKYLAAMSLAIAENNGEEGSLLYSVYNGRDDFRKNNSVGLYAREIPVYYRKKEGETPKSILADIQAQLDFGMAHCDYPFAAEHPANEANKVLFNYQKNTMDLGKISGLIVSRIMLPKAHDQKNGHFICGMIDIEGLPELKFYCGYSMGFYSEEFCERLGERFEQKSHSFIGKE